MFLEFFDNLHSTYVYLREIQAISLLYEQKPDNFTHGAGCVDCAAHDNVTSARKNIRFARIPFVLELPSLSRTIKWQPHGPLHTSRRVTWSTVQEKSISNDFFPFDRNEETQDSERTGSLRFYLLHFKCAAVLTRFTVNNASTPPQSIPVTRAHTLYLDRPSLTRAFDPLLLTTGSTTKKFREELPKILMNGVGVGEIERRCRMKGGGPDADSPNTSTTFGIMKEMQRVCSSTASCPCSHLGSPSGSLHGQTAAVTVSRQFGLSSKLRGTTDERDWMQIFREDVIEAQYKAVLPDQSANSPATERPVETANHFASYLAFPVTFHGLRLQ
ncbi:uncharacterized protein LACBIDRAFT_326709 [Laccaria bicolor S238N-H82]|uniref:Predicted protein n=1 Tax=Laccaria bicolor (strain S238N-H82 / ATCC MYA-4686) TaxID=486041 RepID=B0D9F2_LACBS|nr:uncharacterized protein LACBIDRAFT_326709 [Laccaria bicolor S238N-H82]EDR08344.1 predicted protein [Laccaria bicolor S238N-H82]|eukprot:XP_001880569.1 predicted protein [Laccaria bicolor S238N-H82]